MVGRKPVESLNAWLAGVVLLLAGSMLSTLAQPQPLPGMIAKQETDLLSPDDKLAAYDAEQAVLSRTWGMLGFDWKGPDGAYGTIISSSILPDGIGKRECRRFIHIVHHRNDKGRNPTFQGVVCRSDGGQWRPDSPPN